MKRLIKWWKESPDNFEKGDIIIYKLKILAYRSIYSFLIGFVLTFVAACGLWMFEEFLQVMSNTFHWYVNVHKGSSGSIVIYNMLYYCFLIGCLCGVFGPLGFAYDDWIAKEKEEQEKAEKRRKQEELKKRTGR